MNQSATIHPSPPTTQAFDVVGVGANSIDYVYRLPAFPHPEGPAAKLRIDSQTSSPGGQTATTVSTCAAFGLRAAYVGAMGNDEGGRAVRAALEARGVNLDRVVTRGVRNPYAVILIDESRGERVVLWDRDPALALRPEEIDRELLRRARLVHVDDADEEAAIRAASIAREAAVPVTSDIERVTDRTGALLEAVTIPIFAEHALTELTGERDFERALRTVRRTHRGLLCVTLGSGGALLLDGDRLHRAPGMRVEAVDTTGAGDVFRGAFIHALLRGDAPRDVLRFANAAAALSCTRHGAIGGIPPLAEVTRLVDGG